MLLLPVDEEIHYEGSLLEEESAKKVRDLLPRNLFCILWFAAQLKVEGVEVDVHLIQGK